MSPTAGVPAVTHSEWQKGWAAVFVFSVNAEKHKQNIYKVGKSFAIDCTTRFEVYTFRKKGTKAVTGAVPFQKGTLLYLKVAYWYLSYTF